MCATPLTPAHGGSPDGRFLENVRGYHAVNLAIHLIAGLALFGVVRRTLLTAPLRDTFGAAAPGLAFSIAAIWLVHPLQTSSVTYVVQRVEVLMGMFYLLTLYCSIRARSAEGSAAPVSWSVAAVVSCALGMGSKEVMATAPIVVFLWDFVFDREATADAAGDSTRRSARPGSSWQSSSPEGPAASRSDSASRNGHGGATSSRSPPSCCTICGSSSCPGRWCSTTPGRRRRRCARCVLPLTVISALAALTAWGLRRRSPAAFAGACFFIILAPTSSVLPIVTEVAAEHRMYLPLAAVVALAVAGAFAGLRRVFCTPTSRRAAMRAGAAAIALVVGVLAAMTRARNADYHGYERIWSDTIAKRPRNARARNNFATALIADGRFTDAEAHLRIAVDVDPQFAEAQAEPRRRAVRAVTIRRGGRASEAGDRHPARLCGGLSKSWRSRTPRKGGSRTPSRSIFAEPNCSPMRWRS